MWTKPPVRNNERAEFFSDRWIEAARAYLEPRVAARRGDLRGRRFGLCEVYTDAPPHLGCPGNVASFHLILDDGALTLGRGDRSDVDLHVRADYNRVLAVATAVYEEIPERQLRIQREALYRDPGAFEVKGKMTSDAELGRVLAGLHDHMARRTIQNPDLEQRVRSLGLKPKIDELLERGYTILEGAFSDQLAHELVAEARRCLAESKNRWITGLLLARGLLWEEIAIHPWVYTISQAVLGADCNLGQAAALRKAKGGEALALHNDPPHPLPGTGEVCFGVTTIWALEDFTETSGATVVVPGSHKLNRLPDAGANARTEPITMPRGSVALWHDALWHGNAVRHDPGERLTVHYTYLRNIARTFDDYSRIDSSIVERNPPAVTTLCGLDDLYGKTGIDGPDFSNPL